jgi:hypothetical protein
MAKLTQRLTDPARSGIYRAQRADEVVDAARGTRLDLARVELDGAPRKEALLERLASALGFPAWFGGNWDALEDCLSDLSWRTGTGHVVLIDGYGELPADDLGTLFDVLAAAAGFWAGRGRPFFAVFIDPGHALALPALFRPKAE